MVGDTGLQPVTGKPQELDTSAPRDTGPGEYNRIYNTPAPLKGGKSSPSPSSTVAGLECPGLAIRGRVDEKFMTTWRPGFDVFPPSGLAQALGDFYPQAVQEGNPRAVRPGNALELNCGTWVNSLPLLHLGCTFPRPLQRPSPLPRTDCYPTTPHQNPHEAPISPGQFPAKPCATHAVPERPHRVAPGQATS